LKAMVLQGPKPAEENPLAMADLALPQPAVDEVRLLVHACGVCHTDLHLVEGEIALPRLPIVPGHQIIGQVHALGEGVSRFALGDRVGVPWLYSTCGHCYYCQHGLENLSADAPADDPGDRVAECA